MALVEEALVSLLSGLAGGRVFPYRLPRGSTLPAITYMKVSGPRDETHQGPSGLVPARFQVSSWALTYDAVAVLSDSVRLALDGFKGSASGVSIAGIELLNETDQGESEPETFQKILDFRIKYSETVA